MAIDPTLGFWVYKGCNPACTFVGGPFPAQGGTEYGNLNKDSTEFVGADYQYGQVDVYRYRTGTISYKYSFNEGINFADDPVGAAFNPSSKE